MPTTSQGVKYEIRGLFESSELVPGVCTFGLFGGDLSDIVLSLLCNMFTGMTAARPSALPPGPSSLQKAFTSLSLIQAANRKLFGFPGAN